MTQGGIKMKEIVLVLTEEEFELLKEIISIGFIYSLIQNHESQELITEYIKEIEKWKQKLENVQQEAKDLEELQDKVNGFLED